MEQGFLAQLWDPAHPQRSLGSQSGLSRLPLAIPAWHQRTTLPHPRPCSSNFLRLFPAPLSLSSHYPDISAIFLQPAASRHRGCGPVVTSSTIALCLDFSLCKMGAQLDVAGRDVRSRLYGQSILSSRHAAGVQYVN